MEAVCSTRAIALALALVPALVLCFVSACSFDTSPLGSPAEIESDETPVGAGTSTRDPMFDNTGASVAPIAGSSGGTSAPLVTPAARSDASLPPAVSSDPLAGADAGTNANDPIDAAAPPIDPDPTAGDPVAKDGAVDPPDAGPVAPTPGAPFSRCAQSSDCAEPFVCTSTLTTGGVPGTGAIGYCTAPCPWITGGVGECPQPSSGTIRASCESGIPLCLLESCERGDCPPGLRCLDTETPLGTGQSLHAYACQP